MYLWNKKIRLFLGSFFCGQKDKQISGDYTKVQISNHIANMYQLNNEQI